MGSYILNFVPSTHHPFKQLLSLHYHPGLLIDMAEELDMKGLFYKLANAEQEGEDAVMDRKKITRALKALGITEEFKTEDVLNSMDANGDGTIDLEEWTTCMTPELKRAIYRSLANPDKLNGFQPLVDVAKVFDQFDTDNSGSLSKEEIKYACNCLGLKAWDIDEFFTGLDENADGEISLQEFKDNLPPYVFKAMSAKLTKDGLIEGM